MSPKKIFILGALILAVGCLWWLERVDREVNRIEIGAKEPAPAHAPALLPEAEALTENQEPSENRAFFVEYRLQRERVRAKEAEMLNQIIENEKVSAEGKIQAEQQLLALIALMEKELLVENMVKAKGYSEAVFFYRERLANVVVNAEELSEREVVQLAEMVSGLTGVKMEEVTVVVHQEK